MPPCAADSTAGRGTRCQVLEPGHLLAMALVGLEIEGGEAVGARRRLESGKNVGSAGSMCKLFCSEMVGRVADRLWGGA